MPTRATNAGTGAPDAGPMDGHTGSPASRPVRWWAPRDWRVRSRLVALIVIPTAVALLLGGARISENVINTVTHSRIEQMASLGKSVVELANELGKERLASSSYIADDPDYRQRSGERKKELQDQIDQTDKALQTVRNDVNELGDPGSSLASRKLGSMMEALNGLPGIREDVQETRMTVLPAVTKYRQVIQTLTGFNETIADSTENTELRESVRALSALSKAREQLSYESALMLHALTRGSMSGGVEEAINSSRSRYDNEIQNFTNSATTDQRTMFDTTFTGLDVSQMETMRVRIRMRSQSSDDITGVTQSDNPESYRKISNSSLDKMQQVERNMSNQVQGQAAQLRQDALTRAVLESLLVLGMIIAVFIITSVVVRSLVRPLRALREGALRIAEEDLPDSIVRMQETSSPPEEVEVTPIDVPSRDEIGEVARSFDEVHRVALRLASDEAALRSNVNAMFVNLSRRSQTLVERQLRLIDGLEQSEQDSDRLSDLFQLDHLATRMRRNNENLLVLSGQDNTRKWAQPVPLVDVLRGAISEVEQYDRVNVRAPSHISVLGRPVNDVIHLVAELVENATSFSSNESPVAVTAQVLDDGGVLVEVTDSGIGMAPEEIEETNQRLAEPPIIDVAVSRRMGLFVVSRLAARHGIRVRLASAHNAGITASVLFPPDLLITPVEPSVPALGSAPAVPDTYAEATAAFAANPAPAEPGDAWQPTGSNGDAPGRHSDLPKRQPRSGGQGSPARTGTTGGMPSVSENPPSGEDLWSAGWNTPPAAPEPPASEPERPATPPTPAEPPQQPYQPRSDWSGHAAEPPAGGPEPTYQEPASRDEQWYQSRPSAPQANGSGQSGDSWQGSDVWQSAAEPSASSGHDPGGQWGGASGYPGRSGDQASPWSSDADSREGYGSTAYLSRRYGNSSASHNTVVPPSPESDSEALPIFDAIESNWFRRRTGGPTASDESGPIPRVNGAYANEGRGADWHTGAAEAPRDQAASANAPERPAPSERPDAASTAGQPEEEWRSEADRGWKAARTAAEPIAGGLTQSGLPKRVPKANLVPGTAPQSENVRQIPSRSADRVRDRFAGLQKGVREGRHRTGDNPSEEN